MLPVAASCLATGLGAVLLELIELHDLGHDEALLEVSVDPPGSLRSLVSPLNGPGLDLIRSSREEIDELKGFVSLQDDLLQRG